MTSNFHKNLLPEFDSVKDNNEEILWTGKPKFIPYIFSGLGIGIYLIGFGIILLLITLNFKPEYDSTGGNAWIFGFLPLLQGLYIFLKKIFSFSNTVYAYSNKIVMMRTGFTGTDFKTIDYDKYQTLKLLLMSLKECITLGRLDFLADEHKQMKGILQNYMTVGLQSKTHMKYSN